MLDGHLERHARTVDAGDVAHARLSGRGHHGVVDDARHGDERGVHGLAATRHAHDHLAVQRLAVEASLAGKHQVSLLHEVVEMRGVEHGLRAHLQLRAEERHHARAHAASRTATGQVEHVGAQVALHDGGQVRQASVEHAHLLGSRALLRAKDGGGAGHAAQGVVDVAHGDDLDVADARVHA